MNNLTEKEKYELYKRKYKYLLEEYKEQKNFGCENIHPNVNQNIDDDLYKKLFNVDDIIDYVIAENKIVTVEYPKEFEKKKEYRDKYVELKKIMTNFINNEFFYGDDKFYKFLSTFYDYANDAIIKYINIKSKNIQIDLTNKVKFILKGGCVLKAIFEKFTYLQSGDIKDLVSLYFGDVFNRSDLDFQILIDINLSEDIEISKRLYLNIVEELQVLMYFVMNRFRNIYITKLTDYFNFYQLNKSSKMEKLEKTLKKLNESLLNPEYQDFIKKYHPEYEFILNCEFTNIIFNNCFNKTEYEIFKSGVENDVVIDNEEIKKLIKNIKNNYKNDMLVNTTDISYITEVKKIDFPETLIDFDIEQIIYFDNKISEHYITVIDRIDNDSKLNSYHFTLLRTKINFVLTLIDEDMGNVGIINVPGELIDVAINYYENNTNLKLSNNFVNNVTEYKFTDTNNTKFTKEFSFNSYSIPMLIEDLYDILYDSKFAWEDKEYICRLKKLIFLAMIEFFSLPIESPQIEEILTIIKQLSEIDPEIVSRDEHCFDHLLELSEFNQKLFIIKIILNHAKIYNNIHEDEDELTVESNEKLFIEYYFTIKNLYKCIYDIYITINDCTTKYVGKTNIHDPQFLNIHQIGGIYKKYLKYKNKYLKYKKIN